MATSTASTPLLPDSRRSRHRLLWPDSPVLLRRCALVRVARIRRGVSANAKLSVDFLPGVFRRIVRYSVWSIPGSEAGAPRRLAAQSHNHFRWPTGGAAGRARTAYRRPLRLVAHFRSDWRQHDDGMANARALLVRAACRRRGGGSDPRQASPFLSVHPSRPATHSRL